MSEVGCVGTTIRCFSGRYFDLGAPSADQVDIGDIAIGLANQCRFGGQCGRFYSVAEHSLHCAQVATDDGHPTEVVLAVLMHDAAEAYIGDMVRPLKAMMPAFQELEDRIERAIGERFRIDFEAHREVIKEIDNTMLFHERRALFEADGVTWAGEDQARELKRRLNLTTTMKPQQACFSFGHVFAALSRDRVRRTANEVNQ